jgi:fructose-1-phosphate kinase PfkB-like protein
MFHVVCANPLLDVIYGCARPNIDQRIFFERMLLRAGGFGPNAARALRQYRQPLTCHILTGGHTGYAIRRQLSAEGISVKNHPGPTSRVATIWLAGIRSRMLVSPSPVVTARQIERLFQHVSDVCSPSDVVLIGGSVDQSSMAAYLRIVSDLCVDRRCLCDIRTESWRTLLSARPFVLRIPTDPSDRRSVKKLKQLLDDAVEGGAKLAICSKTSRKLLCQTANRFYETSAPPVSVANPFGAGDCLMASLAVYLNRNTPIAKSIKYSVAAATASVGSELPGDFDPTVVSHLVNRVNVATTS